jgi:elongation factor Ts
VSIEQIKELREATGAGIMECRKALEQSNGGFDEAVQYLHEKGLEKAAERANRETLEGMVELYSHGNGCVGVIVEVNCETDFVARSQEFRTFAHEIALQIAAAAPRYVSEEDIPEEVLEAERQGARQYALDEGKPEAVIDRIVDGKLAKFKDDVTLLNQSYIRDDDLTVEQLLTQNIVSIGEKIIIRRFERWELGEETT